MSDCHHSSLTHIKCIYSLIASLFVMQIVSFIYLYNSKPTNINTIHTRAKRLALDSFSGSQSSVFDDWKKTNYSRKINEERTKNHSNVLKKEEEEYVEVGHSTKIPIVAMEGFCRAAKDFCPPGQPGVPGAQGPPGPRGDPGRRGEKGERGTDGDTGPRGYPGEVGLQGPPGLKGSSGTTGLPGLDGRDGIPGEPGLDGIPGRNGHDGAPGINGLPGRNGTDGIPGMHGYNGTKGEPGSPGPIGPPGQNGIAGPRGRAGKPGTKGIDGTPGVTAYQVSVNGTNTSQLLIPPRIVGADSVFFGGPIIVKERDNVRLHCVATGKPDPVVQWRRLDVPNIELGAWKDSSKEGQLLNITTIRRHHMGTYMCVADNGVPPPANQKFILQVKFEPMISVREQHLRAVAGQNIILRCDVEAFPVAIMYWKKNNNQIIESDNRFSMSVTENPSVPYKSRMELFIRNIHPADFGQYQCVAKNEVGKTTVKFQLDEQDKNLSRPPDYDNESGQTINYGPQPPESVSLDDLCPPPTTCPTCTRPPPSKYNCKTDGSSVLELLNHKDLEVHVFNNYPGMGPRELNCLVYAVGKPVFHKTVNSTYGCWMKDSSPYKTEFGEDTIWTTNETYPNQLYEYANKTMFRKDEYTRIYELKHPFVGSGHVVYNGSFYYHRAGSADIVCYELISRTWTSNVTVPHFDLSNDNRLYSEQHNYMDFSVDDKGLWVIYGLQNSNNTVVLKLQEKTLNIECGWNISVVHRKAGDMFIVCGVLYVVDSNTEIFTHIRFALDLNTNKQVDVDIQFTNPFKKTTMIGYNHKYKELYTWDKGNQLTYPIRYHDQGLTNLTDKEEADKSEPVNRQTTYEIDEKS